MILERVLKFVHLVGMDGYSCFLGRLITYSIESEDMLIRAGTLGFLYTQSDAKIILCVLIILKPI